MALNRANRRSEHAHRSNDQRQIWHCPRGAGGNRRCKHLQAGVQQRGRQQILLFVVLDIDRLHNCTQRFAVNPIDLLHTVEARSKDQSARRQLRHVPRGPDLLGHRSRACRSDSRRRIMRCQHSARMHTPRRIVVIIGGNGYDLERRRSILAPSDDSLYPARFVVSKRERFSNHQILDTARSVERNARGTQGHLDECCTGQDRAIGDAMIAQIRQLVGSQQRLELNDVAQR